MTPLNDFINGETEVDFDHIQTTRNFDLQRALSDYGWDGQDLVEIMYCLRDAGDFTHFMWIVKNIVSKRIEGMTADVSNICTAVTK